MKAFIFENWHAWEQNGKILLSDEINKVLRSFSDTDTCINWLFTNNAKSAAGAMNKNIKGESA